jgi:hypothetical protein
VSVEKDEPTLHEDISNLAGDFEVETDKLSKLALMAHELGLYSVAQDIRICVTERKRIAQKLRDLLAKHQ